MLSFAAEVISGLFCKGEFLARKNPHLHTLGAQQPRWVQERELRVKTSPKISYQL
jgi:hypothetical protein